MLVADVVIRLDARGHPVPDLDLHQVGPGDALVAVRRHVLGDTGGNVKVAVDGRTATNAPAGVFFPEMVMDAEIQPGVSNTLMGSMGSVLELAGENLVHGPAHSSIGQEGGAVGLAGVLDRDEDGQLVLGDERAAGLGADVSIIDRSLPRLRQLDELFGKE